jgi:hypothetical protein
VTEGITTVKRPVARQLCLSTVSNTTTKEGCSNQFNTHIQWDGTERGGDFWTAPIAAEAILRPHPRAVRVAG